MSTDYRSAKCIELHDVHVALTVQTQPYTNALAGRTPETPTRMIYKMPLSGVLAKQLDVRELTVDELYYDGDNDITALTCEIVSAHLVNIRITTSLADDPHARPITELLTYSGSFTIWWVE